jgi:protein tyrosine phosphatase (PTP) superfamily phosphohydrolase (DUF442 family)
MRHPHATRFFLVGMACGFGLLVAGCGNDDSAPVPIAKERGSPADAVGTPHAAANAATKGDAAHHGFEIVKVNDRLYRSAQPEDDEDFAKMAAEGIEVVVSVDGAIPDVEGAARHGIRYVHLPIGYDGVPHQRVLEITRLMQEEDGKILFHCHHGKHRGPAACAVAMRAMGASAEETTAEMKKAGTDPKYVGLYRDTEEYAPPSADEIATVPADLPSAVRPKGTVAAMVQIDETFERIKEVKDAGWASPPHHPDVEPAHEATLLAEAFREMLRLEDVAGQPEDFRRWTKESEQASWELAEALTGANPDRARAERAFAVVKQTCNTCHTSYRNLKAAKRSNAQ